MSVQPIQEIRQVDKEQQKYLVQLWAEMQDMLNSKDARNAWRAIAEAINNKFATNSKLILPMQFCEKHLQFKCSGDKI